MPPPPPFGFTRLYVGHLSPDVRVADLEDKFGRFGRLIDVRIMGAFAFVEFDHPRDADDAQYELDGRMWMGERLVVQPTKRPPRDGPGPPPRGPPLRGPPPRMPPGPPPGVRRGQYRLFVSNLPPGTSWQDVKDLGRKYGWVSFADVDPYRRDEGILEFDNPDDAEDALFGIDGSNLRGATLRADPEDPDVIPRRRRGSPLPPPAPPVRRSPSPRGYRSPPPARGEYRDDYRGYRSPPPVDPRDEPRGGYRSPPPAEPRGAYRDEPRGYRSPPPAEPRRSYRDEPRGYRSPPPVEPHGGHSPPPAEPREDPPTASHQGKDELLPDELAPAPAQPEEQPKEAIPASDEPVPHSP